MLYVVCANYGGIDVRNSINRVLRGAPDAEDTGIPNREQDFRLFEEADF